MTETTLHDQLVAKQTTEELERKRRKASRRGWWTKEDVDYAHRAAAELHASLRIE